MPKDQLNISGVSYQSIFGVEVICGYVEGLGLVRCDITLVEGEMHVQSCKSRHSYSTCESRNC
jgi:hypothetical protein